MLWDIDGTLVDTAGQGRAAFADAFEAVFARQPVADEIPMAGRTDHAICLDLLEQNGVEQPEALLARMFEELRGALNRRRGVIAERGRPQPGVREALAALAARDDVLQSLLTGNIEPNAKTKLAVFGLDSLLDLAIGGYGSDHGTRSELVGIARRKARTQRGADVTPADTVVIGDTPLDVDAARTAGARAVAVATGPYSLAELERAEPHAALEDVRDVEALLAALGLAG